MAWLRPAPLTALSTVVSFIYISQTLERHSLTGRPRLSSLLVLLTSGVTCFAASFLSSCLPGVHGRFSDRSVASDAPGGLLEDRSSSKTPGALMPDRPRRFSLPILVFCIVCRLEVFHRVNYQQQCSTPGVESFLSVLLFGYEIFATRRHWGFPPADDPNDPWRTVFDDLHDWFSGPRVNMVMAGTSVLLFALGTSYSVNYFTRSTYYCFSLIDSRSNILFLQLVGLALDASIIVLLWKVIAWSRNTKLRLRTLGTVLVMSAVSVGTLWLGSVIFLEGLRRPHVTIGSLYAFDIIVDSIAFAVLLASAALWACETSPMIPVNSITIFIGLWTSVGNAVRFGDWLHNTRSGILWPLWIIVIGTTSFTYCHGIQSVLMVRRLFLAVTLVALLVTITIYTSIKHPVIFHKHHPIANMIYKARVAQDRWLREAATSMSLKVAVSIYEERHGGRAPPPNFADWYSYAQGTAILDSFEQIDRDLTPFWGLTPDDLRQRVELLATESGIAMIHVANGKVTHTDTIDSEGGKELDALVAVVEKFSTFLPDMTLPINLDQTPRILPSWEEAHSHDVASISSLGSRISKRGELDTVANTTADALKGRNGELGQLGSASPDLMLASSYREAQVQACAPTSRTKTSPTWDIAQFCWDCAKRHSHGQILSSQGRAAELCEQPDIKHLHGFYLTSPTKPPIRRLAPLFSFAKTEAFSDILIPPPRSGAGEPDIKWKFTRRYDTLFWRGKIGDKALSNHALRGSHKLRLLHQLLSPNTQDEVTLVLPISAEEIPMDKKGNKERRFRYEKVPASVAASLIPYSVSIGGHSSCQGEHCEVVKQAYGESEGVQDPLEYRYVLLLDEDDGPSPQFMRTLRSGSVPFLSTIFKTWYSDRLRPWLHYVPIDPRYQGLHTSFMYFTGTEGRAAKINGRDPGLPARQSDAEWIAEAGRKWAAKALGEKDMEVYMFRLLLEWGRLIDNKRDEVGFRLGSGGQVENSGWSKT